MVELSFRFLLVATQHCVGPDMHRSGLESWKLAKLNPLKMDDDVIGVADAMTRGLYARAIDRQVLRRSDKHRC